MKPFEIKVEGYEVIQTTCRDGHFDYEPLLWDGKKVLIVLLEPYEQEHPGHKEKSP